jgi:hypothetical protein
MSRRGSEGTPQIADLRREEMLTPDEVAAMLGLRGLGWGAKSCVENLLQIGAWLRWWALVGNAQRCPQGGWWVHAAMRRASFLCSRRSSMLR